MSRDFLQSFAKTISSALHAVHEMEPATADDIQSWKWGLTSTAQDFHENTFRFGPHGEEKVCEISIWPEAGDQKNHAQFEGAHCEPHGRQTRNLQETRSQNCVHPSQHDIPYVQPVILGPWYISRRESANSVARNGANLGNVQDDIQREIFEYSQEKARANAIRKESMCTLHSWQQKAQQAQNVMRAEFKAVPIEEANQLCPKNKRCKPDIIMNPSPAKVNRKCMSLKNRKGKGKLIKNVPGSDKFVVQSIGMLME